MGANTYPRPISHVGVTVRDAEAAVEWYGDVLGFETIAAPRTIAREDDEYEHVAALLGVEFDRLTVAHMTTTNDVGFELFEFGDSPESPTTPKATGFNHVGVVDPDIEALAASIDAAGGSHLSAVRERAAGGPKVTYCADPWRNRIEIYTQSHGRFLASLGRE